MDGLNLDEHVGQKWIRLDAEGISPLVNAVIAADANEHQVLAKVNAEIREVFSRNFIAYGIEIDCEPLRLMREDIAQIIEPKAVRDRKSRENLDRLREICRSAEERRIEELKSHPDNGKAGYWQVDGIRNDAVVHASSAIEAVEKAEASGAVGDWESPTACYIGETMPSVH